MLTAVIQTMKNEVQLYNALYSEHKAKGTGCRVSCHVLGKARRSVQGVMRTFGIASLSGARVLDIGCGLGYFSEALREQGADVIAVDSSSVAIEFVKETFPDVVVRVASFPEDFPENEKYDVIWARGLSLINTFDVDFIYRELIQPSLVLLVKGGSLILGWNTNFTGGMGKGNWAHWPLHMIKNMKTKAGLSGPRVVTVPNSILSCGVIHLSRILKRSIPIYFFRRAYNAYKM